MKWLIKIIQNFFYVLSGSILCTAIFITIFWPGLIFPIAVVWQVIIMSAITSFGIFFFYSKSEISKKQMKVRIALHYTYINVIVLGAAILCEWIDITQIVQIVTMILLIATVYIGVNIALFNNSKRMANNINQRLRNRYPEEKKEE